MKVGIFGLGYVGFTAACCIASEGHAVVGFDPNPAKIDAIRQGRAPISEPGLNAMLAAALDRGLLTCRHQIDDALDDCDIAIVCVGTPSAPDGSHNMTYIADVSRQIARALKDGRATPLTVVYRSTIRPGSVTDLIAPIFEAELGREHQNLVELVYNPEFLREASAVKDYFAPPKIVVGTADGRPSANLEALYANIEAPRFVVPFAEAEITKFVDNTWHAVKVAYANEIGRVCLQLGISAKTVHEIFVADTKLNISPYYTRPGGAFGGSCLPKDVRALQYIGGDCGANLPLVDSLIRSNDAHKFRLLEVVASGLAPGASILLSGIAFKADTDDLRESPNIDLARGLLQKGFKLSIFDPAIQAETLVGANLGYAFSHLPMLRSMLIDADAVANGSFDRVIVSNATASALDLTQFDVVDISRLA